MADVLDYQLQHFLRRLIERLSPEEKEQLKTLRLCNVNKNPLAQAVYILGSNTGRSKVYGLLHCRNPWCCPVCAAKEMERHRANIQSAIELLHKEYFGFMVSFAIPHNSVMKCREVLNILYDTWTYFRMKKIREKSHHVYSDLNRVAPIVHHVRVCEQTWSAKHGWHHHFHCIFWVKRGDEAIVSEWEDRLNQFWLKCARTRTLKYWTKHKLHEKVIEVDGSYDKLLDRMYKEKVHHRGVVISRNEDGTIREVDSADYLDGWGADRELTGNCKKKASHAGHYSPYQLLEAAQFDDKLQDVYIDFCLSMTKKPYRHRVDFSQTGLRPMVDAWQKEHGTTSSVHVKKASPGVRERWQVVAYFDKLQWYELCYLDRLGTPVISNIMYLAAKYVYLLGDYLSSLGIEPIPPPRDIEKIEALYNGELPKLSRGSDVAISLSA